MKTGMKKSVTTFILSLIIFLGMPQIVESQQTHKPSGKQVMVQTNYGNMTLLLYDETPKHRDNFIKLVENHTYDGLLFHRVIKDFMIQAGDPESKNARAGQMLGSGTLGYTVPAEISKTLFHKRGALCAARQGDEVNPTRASSASQFYIVQGNVWDEASLEMLSRRTGKPISSDRRKVYTTLGGTPHLDGEYTIFGEVLSGMDVVDSISKVPCDRANRPLKDVKIISMKVIK